jgi:predicted TPR repeat methyltransferase
MTEYVSPTGQTQDATDPVVQVRLRAHGWMPRTELEKVAAHDKAAAQRLEKAREAKAQAARRAEQRRAAQMGEPVTADPPPDARPAADEPEPVEAQAARRSRTTKSK